MEALAPVTLRYWAAAKEAAGVAEDSFAGVLTLAELISAAAAAHEGDGRLARVLGRCAFLVDGDPVGLRTHESVAVAPGAVVEALPPFAGG
jgi:sulfur-carrier protein